MSVTVFFDLGEATEAEITGEAYAVSVSRGRTLEGEAFGPGGGTVRVRNYEANFNPTFLVETFALLQGNDDFLLQANGDRILLGAGNGQGAGTYGEIELGRKVTVKDGAVTVFTGFVEDFDYEYDVVNRSEAVLTVRDGLATLGAATLRGWAPDEQMTGARVSALLDRPEVGFPAATRVIATGTQSLLAGSTTTDDEGVTTYGTGSVQFGTNALQEIQRINRAEYGRCFVNAAGQLVFQDRYEVFGRTPSATFSDDGLNLPMSDVQVRFGTELLHFSVTVTRDGSDTEQNAINAALIAGYPNLGVRHLAVGPLPFASDPAALGLAQLMLQRFQSFAAVISGLSVRLGRLDAADRATVCGLEIGDVVTVSWSPYGTAGQVTQTLAIEAMKYEYRASRNRQGTTTEAYVSFQLSDASDPGYFQVNTDAVNGVAVLAP